MIPFYPVFTALEAFVTTPGTVVVSWRLSPSFAPVAASGFTFMVQMAEAGGSFVDVMAEPVTDVATTTVSFADWVDGERGLTLDTRYFRVVFTDPGTEETPGGVYASMPVQPRAAQDAETAAVINELQRRFLYRAEKQKAGQAGVLLRRKVAGARCPVCYDAVLREASSVNCRNCFGTGFAGGYDIVSPFWVCFKGGDQAAASQWLRGTDGQLGAVSEERHSVHFLCWPAVCGGDIWVPRGAGTRYKFEAGFVATAGVQNRTVVAAGELTLLARSASVYAFEVPEASFDTASANWCANVAEVG